MHSKFDLENQQSKWLSGTEYYNLLTELTRLIKDGREIDSKIPIFASGEHPEDIYFTPRHSMYALLVKSPALVLFPKLANGFRKQITWKRQNFETNLPKSEPIVTYIGAMGQLKEDVDKCYKMHIVWRCDDLSRDNKKDNMVVLCQIRPFKNSQEPWDMSNKENNDCSLPAPGRELDEYLMKIGEEINRRRKEEALQALAREAQENELKSEGRNN
jgi:hypothetical protein